MYDIIITKHARERWVERIADPKRYSHLLSCNKNCPTCAKLHYDIKNVIEVAGHSIDGQIAAAYKEARNKNTVITDKNFIQVQKQFGDYHKFKFYSARNNKAILIVAIDKRTTEGLPLLLSVLTPDMVDGTVINCSNNIKAVFNNWKHEVKLKSFDKKIINL